MGQNFGPPSSFLAKSQSLTWIIRKLSAKGWKSTINVIRTTIQSSACTNRSKIPGILTSSIGISISIRITPQSVRKWPKNVSFDKTPTFSRVFHPKFFWQFFSWNQSCQQLKCLKPQHFHEFFTKEKSTIFSGNQSWIFGQKMKISNSVT